MVYKKYGGSGSFTPQQLHIMNEKEKENERLKKEAAKKKETITNDKSEDSADE